MVLSNPIYYSGNLLQTEDLIPNTEDLIPNTREELAEDIADGAIESGIASGFVGAIENTEAFGEEANKKKLTVKGLFRSNVVGSILTKAYDVLFDSDTDEYTLFDPGTGKYYQLNPDTNKYTEFNPDTGEYSLGNAISDALDVGGAAAVATAIGLLSPIGAGILGAVAIGAGSQIIWNSIKEIDIVEDVFDILNDRVNINIEIVDAQGNLKGGVVYDIGINEEEELSAIDLLIDESFKYTDINVSVGDSIRVINDANTDIFDETRNEYRIYDGKLVDVVVEEFNSTLTNLEPPANSEPVELALFNLLYLGTQNEPNRNIDIYTRNSTLTGGFVYADAENRFFVPLPVANSNEIDVKGFHPGNIYYGTDGGDDISVFENNTSFNSELETDNTLILGLEGDDFLSADVGTNFILGGSGNDNISGIAGEDTVYFTDDFANYDYSIDDRGVITFTHARGTQADGTDTLIDIEQAQFKDRIVSLPLEETEETTPDNSTDFTIEQTSQNQISDNDLINAHGIIYGSDIFWVDNIENEGAFEVINDKILNFDIESREITESQYSNLNLLSPSNYNPLVWLSPVSSDGIAVITEDKISGIDNRDSAFKNLAFFQEGVLTQITDNETTEDVYKQISFSGNNVIWLQDRELFVYDTVEGTTEIIAERRPDSSSETRNNPDLPDYMSSYVTSEDRIAWQGLGDVYFFDGDNTLQLTDTPNIFEKGIDVNENRTIWYTDSPADDDYHIYQHDAAGTELAFTIPYRTEDSIFNLRQIQISTSGDNTLVYNFQSSLESGNKHQIHIHDGDKLKLIHEADEESDVRNIVFAGDNVVWTEEDPQEFRNSHLYLYDGERVIQLTNNDLSHDIAPNFNVKVSENYVAWITEDENNTRQLYWYDGNEIVQLTDGDGLIGDYNFVDDGIAWLYDNRETNTSGAAKYEAFLARNDRGEENLTGTPTDETSENSSAVADTEANTLLLNGTDGSDRLEGTDGNDDIFPSEGNDTIAGGLGSDYISLEAGNDILLYNSPSESNILSEDGANADLIAGFTQGEDKIDLSALGFDSATDLIAAQYTNDEGDTISEVYSRSEDGFSISFEGAYEFQTSDFIFDTADGSSQLDTLTGSESDDSPLYGSFGNDYIEALAGNDDIFAGSGDDTVVSGAGDDYLELGAGSDVILVSSLDDSSNESGVDYVGDFVNGEDKIDVSALDFSNVDDFSVYQQDGYTEIYNGDFALGFDGDYTFNNSDFIFG